MALSALVGLLPLDIVSRNKTLAYLKFSFMKVISRWKFVAMLTNFHLEL